MVLSLRNLEREFGKMNKRGWIKIFEAMLAVTVIFAAIFILNSRTQNIEEESFLEDTTTALDELAKNQEMRSEILNENPGLDIKLREFLDERIDATRFEYEVAACALAEICEMPNPENAGGKEVFSSERVISTNSESLFFSPKKVRIFLWKK